MILIITTTALAVICLGLVVALYLMRKILTASREAAIDTLMVFAYLLKGIEKGIQGFNEKYDVQLRLVETKENGHKKFILRYRDPKDEDSETMDVNDESADTDTPEDK